MVDVPRVREHFERLTNRQLSSPPMSPLVAAKEKSPGAKKPSAKSPDGKSPGGKSPLSSREPPPSPGATRNAAGGGSSGRAPKGCSPSRDSTIAPSLPRRPASPCPPSTPRFALPAPATGGGAAVAVRRAAREGTPPLSPSTTSETKNCSACSSQRRRRSLIFIAHVAFADAPVMAFVRCAQLVDGMRVACAGALPVHPDWTRAGVDASTRMAHALAGVMLDEPFVAAVADARPRPPMRSTHTSRTRPSSHTCTPHVHDPRGGWPVAHAPGAGAAGQLLPPAHAATADTTRHLPNLTPQRARRGPRARTTRTK